LKPGALKDKGTVIAMFVALVTFIVSASYIFENQLEIEGTARLILTICRGAFPIIGFIVLKKRILTPTKRKWIFFALLLLAGVILPVAPNPVDSLQQVFNMFISERSHGLPGVIGALIVCLLANKIACGWACQLGALQDLIFRLNRNKKDNKGIFKQYKVPFKVSNTIRIVFTSVVVFAAMILAIDAYTPVDPMFVFDPTSLGILGLAVALFVLGASLFIYRPWCYFFCPFGLLGWFSEKYSMHKIYIDRDVCTSCQVCAKACPSNTMDAILNQKKTIPDCFICGSCISACPKKAVHFDRSKKTLRIKLDKDRNKDECAR